MATFDMSLRAINTILRTLCTLFLPTVLLILWIVCLTREELDLYVLAFDYIRRMKQNQKNCSDNNYSANCEYIDEIVCYGDYNLE